jgi:hypothetical protein
VRYLLTTILLISCGSLDLTSIPDSGRYIVSPTNVVVPSDAGTISCVPNQDCWVDAGTPCHAGVATCAEDGKLNPCQAYTTCPIPLNNCASPGQVVFIIDDGNDMTLDNMILVQQALATYIFENPNLTFALAVTPGCGGDWAPVLTGYIPAQNALEVVSIQCLNSNQAPNLGATEQKYTGQILVFTNSPNKLVESGSIITFGVEQYTLDELLTAITFVVVC